MHTSRIAYRPDVDGLRAVAVLSVVLFHAGLGFPGGYVGVDVFFVISGYLIMSLILRDVKQGSFSLVDFWERRIRRIVPALLVVLAATVAIGFFILFPKDFRNLGKPLISIVLMSANFRFWSMPGGYFDPVAEENPVLHTWSLAVEEQFYLIIPMVLFFLVRFQRTNWLFRILAVTFVLSLATSILFIDKYPKASFFLLPARAWELLAGGLLAMLPVGVLGTKRWLREIGAIAGLALILWPTFYYYKGQAFPGLNAIPPVLGACLLIWAGRTRDPDSAAQPGDDATYDKLPLINQLLTLKPVVFVGLISYSLYLWHWPIMAYTTYIFGNEISTSSRLILVAMSVVMGILSWRFVERPFRSRSLFTNRKKLFVTNFAMSAGVIGIGLMLFKTEGLPQRYSDESLDIIQGAFFDQSYPHILEVADVPENLIPFGAETDQPATVLLWGDSHARSLLPGLDSLFKELGLSGVCATRPGTPPVKGFFQPQLSEAATLVEFCDAVIDHIKNDGTIKHVLMVGYWDAYLRMNKDQPDYFCTPLFDTIDELQAAGVNVYYMKNVPIFPRNVSEQMVFATYMPLITKPVLTKAEFEANSERQLTHIIPRLKERNVHIIDPSEAFFADSSEFRPYDEGGSYYFDRDHITVLGAKKLKPLLSRELGSIIDQHTTIMHARHPVSEDRAENRTANSEELVAPETLIR